MDFNSGFTNCRHGLEWVNGDSPGLLYNSHNICTNISCNSAPLHEKLSPEQCQGNCDMPVNHGLESIACEVVGENAIGTKQVNMVPELEFQACNICPKNFLIFDQNDSKSRMIFHPALTDKDATLGFCDMWTHENHDESKESSFKEDTRDIDALLSSDEVEEEADEISTGRSPWEHDSGKSPDGLSMATSRDISKAELYHFYEQNPEAACIDSQCTDQMVQKMIEALRQIIPGGERMDPTVVLDEALRYLKLLKMEVKQLGLG